jgi:hypothetical protein
VVRHRLVERARGGDSAHHGERLVPPDGVVGGGGRISFALGCDWCNGPKAKGEAKPQERDSGWHGRNLRRALAFVARRFLYCAAMHRTWLGRTTVILVVAGILAGGSGAPVVDALLYHTHPSHTERVGPHFEPQGTRHAHGDECTLGQLLNVQPSASTELQPARIDAHSFITPCVWHAPAPHASRTVSLQHSRAPPARNA